MHCLSSGADRPEPARYGARASQARVVRLLPRESERSGARACAPRKSRLCVGGRSWQVAPRSCTEGDRPVAGAVPFHRIHADYNQRGTARANRKLLCCACSPETASAVARSCVRRAKAGCVFEASAGRHVAARACAEGERPLAGAVLFPKGTDRRQSARHGARVTGSRTALLLKESERSGALACAPHESRVCVGGRFSASHQSLAPKERGLSPVQCSFLTRRPTTASTAWCARVASSRAAPPLQRERAQWRARVRATQKPAVCWRPQLARRTKVLHRNREASRWRSAFS